MGQAKTNPRAIAARAGEPMPPTERMSDENLAGIDRFLRSEEAKGVPKNPVHAMLRHLVDEVIARREADKPRILTGVIE